MRCASFEFFIGSKKQKPPRMAWRLLLAASVVRL
jgi:hypothetical protein